MNTKFLTIIIIVFSIRNYNGYSVTTPKSFNLVKQEQPRDLVPDKETAIRIAIAVWLPIYGKDIKREKPYVATLGENGVWEVKGTLSKKWKYGGVAYAYIQKSDGRVLKVIHTK